MGKSIKDLQKQFEGDDYKYFKLPECELVWPHFNRPDEAFGKPGKFKGNFILDDELADELAAVGFNVKPEKLYDDEADEYVETGRRFVQPTRKEEFGPPKVTYKGKPYTGEIGNGSRVIPRVSAKYTTVGGKKLLPIYLDSVDIVDLVEYEGSSNSDEEDLFG